VADCSFSVIKPVFNNSRSLPLGCVPDDDLMSFIARRSGGVMWTANLAVLGAVLITPDLFGSLDQFASLSHSLPEIQIILDSVSQRRSFFPIGRSLEPQQLQATSSSLQTVHPSLGGAGGVTRSHLHQPRLLHKDAQSSNMQVFCDFFQCDSYATFRTSFQLWISSKARLGFVPRMLRRAVVGGSRREFVLRSCLMQQ
jgi:hypothetical protein